MGDGDCDCCEKPAVELTPSSDGEVAVCPECIAAFESVDPRVRGAAIRQMYTGQS